MRFSCEQRNDARGLLEMEHRANYEKTVSEPSLEYAKRTSKTYFHMGRGSSPKLTTLNCNNHQIELSKKALAWCQWCLDVKDTKK